MYQGRHIDEYLADILDTLENDDFIKQRKIGIFKPIIRLLNCINFGATMKPVALTSIQFNDLTFSSHWWLVFDERWLEFHQRWLGFE